MPADVKALQRALAQMQVDAARAAVRVVRRQEAEFQAAVQRSFTGAHPPRTPTPSRPGMPPSVISGTLRRSFVSTPAVLSGLTATGRVYPSTVYARIQELGGVTGRNYQTRLPARQYMAPTRAALNARLGQIARDEFAKVTR